MIFIIRDSLLMSLNAVNGTLKRYVPNPLTQSKGFDPLSTIPYITVGLLAALFLYRYLTPEEKGGIRQLGGLPILSAWAFFAKRYDFVWANFGRDLHFRFKVFHVGPFIYIGICPRLTNIAQCHCRTRRGSSENILQYPKPKLQRGL